MARRLLPSRALDAVLVVGVLVPVAIVVLAAPHLRPFDAPELDPRPALLPLYLLRSLSRLLIAYALAVVAALVTGYLAAERPLARRVILPVLDVLQSVPILGFFPAAVGVFIGLFGASALGVEAAAVFLIFTSMFWNLAFGVYESLITLPEDLRVAAVHLNLRGPLRWTRLILPATVPSLVYNSILSWANGWYFLIASEIIAAGPARYTLPGLGSYLAQALDAGRNDLLALALLTLVAVTVLVHLLVWSPLETFAERFHLEETGDRPRVPRIARLLGRSRLVHWLARRAIVPLGQRALVFGGRVLGRLSGTGATGAGLAIASVALLSGWAGFRVWRVVTAHPLSAEARAIPLSLVFSFLRVSAGVAIAVALSVPLAYAVFRRQRLRLAVLSGLQIACSIPAPAFFPLIAILVFRVGLGMNLGSVLLVLTGTFFYVMFNVLSGAAAIPKVLNEAASTLGLSGWGYVRRVFVPAVLPSLVTGCVTAWGGGWNAIIFSEYIVAGGQRHEVRGVGAILDRATYAGGDPQVVALSLVSMVVLIICVNRLFWDPLYEHVARRYKMDS